MGFKPRQRRVCVHWDDSTSLPGWRPLDEPRPPEAQIQTMGFLLSKNKEAIEVAQSLGEGEMVSDVARIPRAMVRRIERL